MEKISAKDLGHSEIINHFDLDLMEKGGPTDVREPYFKEVFNVPR